MTPDRMVKFPYRLRPAMRRAKFISIQKVRHSLKLDLHIDARGQIELHQSVNRLRRRIDDVENPFVSPDLELFARFLIDMRRTVDAEFLDLRRQRNGATHLGSRPLRRRDDLLRRGIEDSMIECLEANANILAVHLMKSLPAGCGPWPRRLTLILVLRHAVTEWRQQNRTSKTANARALFRDRGDDA